MVLGHDLSTGQRTQDVRVSEDVSFDTMLLRKPTLKGLKNAGFLRPSPVQLHAIPLGKCGFDLLLEAKSGTGKTAVFTVISLEKLDLTKGVQTIILAPTREIASQISDVITEIGSYYKGLNVAVVMGGLPVKEDIKKFSENVHIVVGSPGRLRHLIHDKHITLSAVRLFVLDEADKLMEKSFLPDINYIFSVLPKQKQVIMSSATYSEETKTFIKKYVQESQHICPDSSSVLLGISQKVTIVPYNSNIVKQTKHRYEELKKILNTKQFKQCLIFCNYQARVGELHKMLSRDKWPVEQLYGQQDQIDRLDALKTLQEYKCRILVSTDLAARGIDASNVDIVINFEPPYEWQTYLHRIGRAGRYGSYGTAISILSEGKEEKKFKETLALTNIPFNLCDLWTDEPFNLSHTDVTLEKDEASVTISPYNMILENEEDEEEKLDVERTELWQALTTESIEPKDIKPEIPSFEDLCDSFKISGESPIETFSNLIHSFNVDQNKTNSNSIDNFEFKHVKVAKLPITRVKYLDNLDIGQTKEVNNIPNVGTINKRFLNFTTNITNGDPINEKKLNRNERYLTEGMEKEMANNKVLSYVYRFHKSNNTINEAEAISQKFERELNENSRNPLEQTLIDNIMSLPTDFVEYNQDKMILHNDNERNSNETYPNEQTVVDENFSISFGNKKDVNHEIINNDNEINESDNDKQVPEGAIGLESIKKDIHNGIKYSDHSHHYETTIYDSDNDPVKQALIDAGLPTAFGKVKENKHRNNTYNCSNNDTERIKTDKSKAKQMVHKPLKNQEIYRNEVKNISSSRTFTRESYKQKDYTTTDVESEQSDLIEIGFNEKNTSKLKNNYASNTSSYNKKSCHRQTKNHSSRDERIREKQFYNWYNQLKHHSHTIQYALYIEELRKL